MYEVKELGFAGCSGYSNFSHKGKVEISSIQYVIYRKNNKNYEMGIVRYVDGTNEYIGSIDGMKALRKGKEVKKMNLYSKGYDINRISDFRLRFCKGYDIWNRILESICFDSCYRGERTLKANGLTVEDVIDVYLIQKGKMGELIAVLRNGKEVLLKRR
jgi:hypothetical protein